MPALPFKVLGISHLGLAPRDVGSARHLLQDLLGLPSLGDDTVPDQQVNVTMLGSTNQSSTSPTRLELLSNIPGTDGPIGRFVTQKGGGIHHVALRVDSITQALAYLKAAGVKLIDETPRAGAHGAQIAFIHPHASGGLLIELVEENP